MEFLIGTGKSTIKCFKTDIGMMGYGMSSNTVHSSATDLFSRSISIRNSGLPVSTSNFSFSTPCTFLRSKKILIFSASAITLL